MKIDDVLQELQSEPVTQGAMERTLRSVLHPAKPTKGRMLRRSLVFAVGIGAATVFSIYPWRNSDRSWAQAKANLFDAKMVHMKLTGEGPTGKGEVWIHGDKISESNSLSEYRCNGKIVSQKVGRITSTWPKQKFEGIYLKGTSSFWSSVQRIKAGNATRGTAKLNGKIYRTYRFNSGGIVVSSDSKKIAYVGDTFMTAYVDEDRDQIVRIVQDYKLRQSSKSKPRTYDKAFYDYITMTAEIDYPESIDDHIFDPPADAFDRAESKTVVANALAGSVGEAEAAGQKVKLHGVFFDGVFVNVIWSGQPADFESKDRFQIEGVRLGETLDVRCLSSGKFSKPTTANVPFCLQGSKVQGDVPTSVTITVPVFAPDKTRPYPGKKGFHSKKVGEVTFQNVPVTPIVYLQTYERQLGLVGKWW